MNALQKFFTRKDIMNAFRSAYSLVFPVSDPCDNSSLL